MSSYFSLIPSGVMHKKEISDSSKITYAMILGLANKYGYCFATNKYLASARGMSLSGIQRHLVELKDNDCIIIEINQRNDRRITPIVNPSNYEKVAKNSKNKQYGVYDDDIDRALDDVWKNIK
jgi:hypothetical protein